VIGSTISHYKILEKLGEGGMGVVYRAHDNKLARDVALKFLPHHLTAHEAEQARFLHEARAASALNHPNVCVIHDIQEHEGQQFIIMEYVDGKTLRQLVPIQKTQNAIEYAIQIGDALHEAHSKGIVHRDIKTDNIMINSKNQLKVMDFGLAKLKGSMKLTKTSSTVGTLAYMAPEQIQGGEVDARSDIFSFGVVLYEMLTGHTPFRGEHEAAMVYSIVNEEPTPLQKYLPEASSELVHILNRALEKDPADRYQSVAETVIDLRRLKKETSRVYRTQNTEGIAPRISSRWLIAVAGVFGVVALAMLAFLLFSKRGPELNPDRKERFIDVPFTEFLGPVISKDGRWMVFAAADANGKWDFYNKHLDSEEQPKRITFDYSAQCNQEGFFSPDGSKIVYVRWNASGRNREICIVSALGPPSKRIVDVGYDPRWRPDGERIGFILADVAAFRSSSGKREFWSVRPDGSNKKLEFIDSLSEKMGSIGFSWSPDGKSVAWIRDFPGRFQEIIIKDLATGRERPLTNFKSRIDAATWTANDQIVFSSDKSGDFDLWTMPASGGEEVQITKSPEQEFGTWVSDDGKRSAYMQLHYVSHIWMANTDGTNARKITAVDRFHITPGLSPDKRQLAFVVATGSVYSIKSHIYLADIADQNLQKVTSGEEWVLSPIYSPDGRWIAYEGGPRSLPYDSAKTLLLDAREPGAPKPIATGRPVMWLDSTALLVLHVSTQNLWLAYVDGSPQKQFSPDSIIALPVLSGKYLLYSDRHHGKRAVYLAPADYLEKPSDSRLKLLETLGDRGVNYVLSPTGTFCIAYNDRGEAWRLDLPSGKKERLRSALPRLSSGPRFPASAAISYDAKEIVYSESPRTVGKIVLIEDLFR
jgi:Tol biopolymer transport system component/predicted Ser/Thr protein kinase